VLPVRYELNLYICYVEESGLHLWPEFLATDAEARIRFPALPDFSEK
jgi:hypothetical protein